MIEGTLIGTCSICGGDVYRATSFLSTVVPRPACVKCGAVAKAALPTVDMEPRTHVPMEPQIRQLAKELEELEKREARRRRATMDGYGMSMPPRRGSKYGR